MRRRLALMFASVLVVGSLQVAVAPAASAATTTSSTACADPHCPWSPVTMLVKRLVDKAVDEVDRICDQITVDGCPL
jgi:hypothetical protein